MRASQCHCSLRWASNTTSSFGLSRLPLRNSRLQALLWTSSILKCFLGLRETPVIRKHNTVAAGCGFFFFFLRTLPLEKRPKRQKNSYRLPVSSRRIAGFVAPRVSLAFFFIRFNLKKLRKVSLEDVLQEQLETQLHAMKGSEFDVFVFDFLWLSFHFFYFISSKILARAPCKCDMCRPSNTGCNCDCERYTVVVWGNIGGCWVRHVNIGQWQRGSQ